MGFEIHHFDHGALLIPYLLYVMIYIAGCFPCVPPQPTSQGRVLYIRSYQTKRNLGITFPAESKKVISRDGVYCQLVCCKI